MDELVIDQSAAVSTPLSNNDSIANECSICLDTISLPCQLNCCIHVYDYQCIYEWCNKISNDCPLCKSRINQLIYTDENHVEKHIDIADKIQIDPDTPPNVLYAVCLICGSDSDEQYLLLCDGCDRAYHTYCVGLDHTVPSGEWKCESCTVHESIQPEQRIRRQHRSRRLRRYDTIHTNNNNNSDSDSEYKPDDVNDKPPRRARTANTSSTARRVRQLRQTARQAALNRRAAAQTTHIHYDNQNADDGHRHDHTDNAKSTTNNNILSSAYISHTTTPSEYTRATQLVNYKSDHDRIIGHNRRNQLMNQYIDQRKQGELERQQLQQSDPKLAELTRKYADMLYSSYNTSYTMKQITNDTPNNNNKLFNSSVHNNAFITSQQRRILANNKLHYEPPINNTTSNLSLTTILNKQEQKILHPIKNISPATQYHGVEFSKKDKPGQYAHNNSNNNDIIHIDCIPINTTATSDHSTATLPSFELPSFDDFVESLSDGSHKSRDGQHKRHKHQYLSPHRHHQHDKQSTDDKRPKIAMKQ